MIWQLNAAFLLFGLISAFAALWVKDLLAAAILLSAFSFFMCLTWAEIGAVDVAFTEAAVGAGVSAAFYIAAIFHINRRTKD